ncbi:MAG: hypothetical protein A2Y10_06820 [Planctomycetes bacterium GWF2_41_51]|nr:MAG: hypothetical protein A2Y10_06820 [Planctomycetes bacterium GWF2_41_51]HBG27839.1 hypothetical protein [Phycisphaerales bacterium]
MNRAFYSDSIYNFLSSTPVQILGEISKNNPFTQETLQRDAWLEQINILKTVLRPYQGNIYFEFSIPRMGQRIDTLLLIGSVIFVLEFKVGATKFAPYAIDQVWDYALDLKNFHESSHHQFIAPILISTEVETVDPIVCATPENDKLLLPIESNVETLSEVIKTVLDFSEGQSIDHVIWENGRYCPTPTIIEAAIALYKGHSVEEISRNDAEAINLSKTSEEISSIIKHSRENFKKSICFVTGVPGAGKTLVGLNIANTHSDESNDLYSVYLSGNGPLVKILREALVRDKVKQEKKRGKKLKKGDAFIAVKARIQNIHNFRDDCLEDENPPIEHVALFDEAQRAWNIEQTAKFMKQKKNRPDFNQSEPEFLISVLDRHPDWAVIICLVGGGQEINTGEAGIGAWIDAVNKSFPNWNIYISPRLTDSEYVAGAALSKLESRQNIFYKDELHLAVSMRSFRAENVSLLVKQILDFEIEGARSTLNEVKEKYPIFISRNLHNAKKWLKQKARGSERYGIVVSSQAQRLRPHAIHVKSPMNPIHWFLNGKEDIRSSYYLEDVATEFSVQGLELDWVCVTWDADFRYSKKGWKHWSFSGDSWKRIKKDERQAYLKNAYRVLLTRARQGMVIVVPEGNREDKTRASEFYDPTFEYLKQIGFEEV